MNVLNYTQECFATREMSSLQACAFALTDVTVPNYIGLTQVRFESHVPLSIMCPLPVIWCAAEAWLRLSRDISHTKQIVEKTLHK